MTIWFPVISELTKATVEFRNSIIHSKELGQPVSTAIDSCMEEYKSQAEGRS